MNVNALREVYKGMVIIVKYFYSPWFQNILYHLKA